eukprot:TRINITY_DN1386_c1_g1_i1.p1 TRINITY_DN1386_c1_g1~~TRINITY_DN1386_c1_g1_i1.p1  ORF type:complete len:2083 (+),score=1015.05 TRINITY_DN1386_c1_g1_i1:162-6410(+)
MDIARSKPGAKKRERDVINSSAPKDKQQKKPKAEPRKAKPIDVDDLPRGGVEASGHVERRDEPAADNLFGAAVVKKALQAQNERKAANELKKQKKAAKRNQAAAAAAAADEAGDAAVDQLVTSQQAPKRADGLTFKTLSVGMSLLGAVRDTTDLDLVLSLPNNLKGFVNLTEISDVLTERLERSTGHDAEAADAEEPPLPELSRWFSAGQLVPCRLIQLDSTGANRVELSTRERHLNAGIARESLNEGLLLAASVRSVEDHGYVLSLGLPYDCTGFVPTAAAAAHLAAIGRDSLDVGQPVYGLVTSVDADRRAVTLSLEPRAVARAVAKPAHVVTIESLKAGTLVSARIDKRLSNGLWLSFLHYFTGIVDAFHLRSPADLAADSTAGQKVKGRIIWVDYEAKAVGLSLLEHVVGHRAHRFPPGIRIGDYFDNATVERVDSGVGIVLRLPAGPDGDGEQQQAAFVHISHVSDRHVDRLDKGFKPGDLVPRCRVLGIDALDGLVNVTLKASVLEQPLMSLADVRAGMLLDGTIARIRPEAIMVAITETIQGRCAAMHFADVRIHDPTSKFKEGQKFKVRVLSVDVGRRRLQLSHKRTLLNSDLAVLDTWEAATVGTVAHGYVTKVAAFGCIVSFYNDVHGLVPTSELSSQYVADPQKAFQVGQVVTCRVISSDPAHRKLRLSLKTLPAIGDSAANGAVSAVPGSFEAVEAGSVVSATIKALINDGAVLLVETASGVSGMVPQGQLADDAGQAERLMPRLAARAGTQLTELLVLDKHPAKKTLLLSLKPSLIAAAKAGKLPRSIEQLSAGMVVSGWVKGVTDFGVFVGVLGGLSGLAYRANLSDASRQIAVEQAYTVNQSVRAYVSEVDTVANKVSFSLQASLTAALPDEPSWLELYLRHEQFISHMARTAKERTKVQPNWPAAFPIGARVDAELSLVKPFGSLFKLKANAHVTGFSIAHHAQGVSEPGAAVRARVLDIDADKLIVDLSLRASHQPSPEELKASIESLRVGSVTDATVDLVKEHYVVVTLSHPKGVVGFAQVGEFNEARDTFSAYKPGQKIRVAVLRKPNADDAVPRLLLSAVRPAQAGRAPKMQQQQASSEEALSSLDQVAPGMSVQCKVTGVYESQLALSIGLHLHGRMHITEVFDEPPAGDDGGSAGHAFAGYPVGTEFTARIIALANQNSGHYLPITHQKSHQKALLEVSVRPSVMSLPDGEPLPDSVVDRLNMTLESLRPADSLVGVVQSVSVDAAWVHVTRAVRGRLFVLDTSDDMHDLTFFQERYRPGQLVRCQVLSVDTAKRSLDLTLNSSAAAAHAESVGKSKKKKSAKPQPQPQPTASRVKQLVPGAVVPGRVSKLVPGVGLMVQLGAHRYGRVHLTDLSDVFRPEPLAVFEPLQFVKCYVVAVSPDKSRVDLSLRASRVGGQATTVEAADEPVALAPGTGGRRKGPFAAAEISSYDQLQPGAVVAGYVQVVKEKVGVMVAFGRDIVGRATFNELADDFIKSPDKVFPAGKLVQARVKSVDVVAKRVEVSLRPSAVDGSQQSNRRFFADLKTGDKLDGKIKSVVPGTGVFVQLAHSSVTGLCHVSEISDDYLKDPTAQYKAGDSVRVLIIKLDAAKKRVSFSLKPSHFADDAAEHAASSAEDSDAESESESESDEVDEVQIKAEPAAATAAGAKRKRPAAESAAAGATGRKPAAAAATVIKPELDNDTAPISELDIEELLADGEPEDAPASDDELTDAVPPAKTPRRGSHDETAAAGGLHWEEFAFDDDEPLGAAAAADHSDDDQDAAKRGRRAKKSEQRRREKLLAEREQAMATQQAPTTAADFERLLLSAGGSSFVWINYIAHHVALQEVDKARAIAERALKAIDVRDEEERLNVWLAWLNLESAHGSDDTWAAVLSRALTGVTEPKPLYMRLADSLERSGRLEKAEDLYKTMTKKFKESSKVWRAYATMLLKHERVEQFRAMLAPCLKALPKRKHLAMISKFGQLEFKHGAAERGRTIFEGIVSNYPKRVDLWNVYVDMELRSGDLETTRHLFERVTSLSLSSKKMKHFFKRYLEFEKQHGDAALVERVKDKARQYVAAKTA